MFGLELEAEQSEQTALFIPNNSQRPPHSSSIISHQFQLFKQRLDRFKVDIVCGAQPTNQSR